MFSFKIDRVQVFFLKTALKPARLPTYAVHIAVLTVYLRALDIGHFVRNMLNYSTGALGRQPRCTESI